MPSNFNIEEATEQKKNKKAMMKNLKMGFSPI
jgi:hypothetical protein